MTPDKLKDFFEKEDFLVHPFEQDGQQCAEVEKWTNGGVDMIITLIPFAADEFISYVDNFSVDEEVDEYRQDNMYRKAFTIQQSLEDFTNFYEIIKEVSEKLKKEE